MRYCHMCCILLRPLSRLKKITPCVIFRRSSPVASLSAVVLFVLISVTFLTYRMFYEKTPQPYRDVPKSFVVCGHQHVKNDYKLRDHSTSARLRLDPKVLLFTEGHYHGQEIVQVLEANRIKYKLELPSKSLPVLTNLDRGKFGVIIFENFDRYLMMDKWNRDILDKYCREYDVGIIAFVKRENNQMRTPIKGFPIFTVSVDVMENFQLNKNSSILRILKPEHLFDILPVDNWVIFETSHASYYPVAFADAFSRDEKVIYTEEIARKNLTVVLHDTGIYDGIQRVLLGNSLSFWINRLLLLDSISCLSHGRLSTSLTRYIQIDIDDIFVGQSGVRMLPQDVEALINSQSFLSQHISGFQFNLGFSGKYFHAGNKIENQGDDMLLANSGKFRWFGHTWAHTQPHKYHNYSALFQEMSLNKKFAKKYDLPTDSHYSIAPHHSGVYPVHDMLYDVWREVWDIGVTSTEEYPQLRPAYKRRGFIYKGIMVLPRQTCGLFTHTIFIDQYPNGRHKLDNSIQGGELFQQFVFNPINIFMTHLSNYGNDRLALYTFESVIKFVECWTNLKLLSIPPVQLGKLYFNMYPEEREPVWQNPCNDKRHISIWASNKSCDRLPDFIVIGPQKTGTTALHTFLKMHPNIISNVQSDETYEEVQFFNGANYNKGLDWYMNFFPVTRRNRTTAALASAPTVGAPHSNTNNMMMSALDNDTQQQHDYKVVFEKSASYFDNDLVPKRVFALLPHVKLICILTSPSRRAYSWYYHQRSHSDVTALNNSFYNVITGREPTTRALRSLRHRCLNPGVYVQHIDRWLQYFSPKQLLIIDGDKLKAEPVSVMNSVQDFLEVKYIYPYEKYLRYDPKKGFYCQVLGEGNGNASKCLGKGKGRSYPPMDVKSERYLSLYYKSHNQALYKLLHRLGYEIPQWLSQELRRGAKVA